jgi:hypothetical protein
MDAACTPLTTTVAKSPIANTSFVIVFIIFLFSFPQQTSTSAA